MLPGNAGEFLLPDPEQGIEKDKRLMQTLTPFGCQLCEYPLLATWKYCPHCGGQVIWTGNTSEAGHGSTGS